MLIVSNSCTVCVLMLLFFFLRKVGVSSQKDTPTKMMEKCVHEEYLWLDLRFWIFACTIFFDLFRRFGIFTYLSISFKSLFAVQKSSHVFQI